MQILAVGLAAILASAPGLCPVPGADAVVAPDPPEYYTFALVTTKNVPGSARATGVAEVTYATSPFGVSIAPDGSYLYDVHATVEDLQPTSRGVFTVWLTKSDLSEIERVGVLAEDGRITGRVAWNKFLVVITLEEADDPDAERWDGPVVLRGMSRSGMMHTMAGHGPFEQENCAAFGYGG